MSIRAIFLVFRLMQFIAETWGALGCAVVLVVGIGSIVLYSVIMQVFFPPPPLVTYAQPVGLNFCKNRVTLYAAASTGSRHTTVDKPFDAVYVDGEKGEFYYLKDDKGDLWILKQDLCSIPPTLAPATAIPPTRLAENTPAVSAVLGIATRAVSSDTTFPRGTPQSQTTQYGCSGDFIDILTFREGDFVSSGDVYANGDEIKVYGRVGEYYFVGVDEKKTAYYVRTSNVCTARPPVILSPAATAVPEPTNTRTPSRTPTPANGGASASRLDWEADFHDMTDREITICADAADIRSGPDTSYPIVYHMTVGDHATAYGWVGNWFYLGTDDAKVDYFVVNSDVCPLNQGGTQSSPQSAATLCTPIPNPQGWYEEYLNWECGAAPAQPAQNPCPYPADGSLEGQLEWVKCNGPSWTATAQVQAQATADYQMAIFGPCDTFLYNQWASGKSSRFVPECTPTPRPR